MSTLLARVVLLANFCLAATVTDRIDLCVSENHGDSVDLEAGKY